MAKVLFLVHRIPYPPNKGDKIRSFHWLKALSQRHRLWLGTFVDDAADWAHADAVRDHCEEALLLPLSPRMARLRSLKGLATGDPLTLPYYANARLRRWAGELVTRGAVDTVFVFSSAMAQFADAGWPVRKLIDFVDVDSDKWRQYAKRKPLWSRWIYRREAEKLLAYDRRVARDFDLSLFVSEAEAELFRRLAPEVAEKMDFVENGVDLAYFRGGREFPNPYRPGEQALVFTGAMDYWPNIDAVRWFAERVFPRILQHHVDARFYVVGARPTEAVRLLGRREGVVVTGQVDDIRPYLAHARLAVAPLRVARGIQNKVLEAMAMAKSLLASPQALDGLAVEEGLDLEVAEDPGTMAARVAESLENPDFLPRFSQVNRRFVEKRYSWDRHIEKLHTLLER
ncbi:polysaccharide biosynthesis protein PslH [Methylomarinovum tepidoasis]|uniref:Polysaccharide biosynthesis protein PslH n=1 Tax=Methylomarinovum tepidoasis TaxID=2840183 RepID=A0AAU9C139_9GAMM|nr:TIGR03087 family PEP-CTERM/XrtA system glycosyltransferase [Methylomarinovum sp. IN45]BCX89810.1 polysaccharide biosynthesis protein PslH [Methylomarinovum sp. IN45]